MNQQYLEDDLLMLSGIQHMAFCERQWALIHIEQVWAENVRTLEGKYLHDRADDPFADESRKTLRIIRSMPLVSYRLGLRGIADIVEFYKSTEFFETETCRLQGRSGWWRAAPVEYKRGRPKSDDRDAVQLCAQAIALEEMLHISIPNGYIYYGETRHRQFIGFDVDLRQYTNDLAVQMHQLVKEGITPKAKKGKRCSQCSLVENCQPRLMLRHRPVNNYLKRMYKEEVDHF